MSIILKLFIIETKSPNLLNISFKKIQSYSRSWGPGSVSDPFIFGVDPDPSALADLDPDPDPDPLYRACNSDHFTFLSLKICPSVQKL